MHNNSGRLLTFKNIKFGKATFASATYDQETGIVAGYAFLRHVADLDTLINQLRASFRPNAFVDELRVVTEDQRLAHLAEKQMRAMALDDPGLSNVGLYWLNVQTGDFDELISPQPNNDFWYTTYVKPTEVQKLLATAQEAKTTTVPLRATSSITTDEINAAQAEQQTTLVVAGDQPVRAQKLPPQESLIAILDDYDKHLIDTTEIFRKFIADTTKNIEREAAALTAALEVFPEGDAAPNEAPSKQAQAADTAQSDERWTDFVHLNEDPAGE